LQLVDVSLSSHTCRKTFCWPLAINPEELANLKRQKPGLAQMLMIRLAVFKNEPQKLKTNARLCAYSWLAANDQGLPSGVELGLCPPGPAVD
jgi:hypothetical protein